MAIINCPECQNEISDSAKSCPYCGYKINKVKTLELSGIKYHDEIIYTIIGIGIIIGLYIDGLFEYYLVRKLDGFIGNTLGSFDNLVGRADLDYFTIVIVCLIALSIIASWLYSYLKSLKGKKNMISLIATSLALIVFVYGTVTACSNFTEFTGFAYLEFERLMALFYIDIAAFILSIIVSILNMSGIYIIKSFNLKNK